jgi:transcriptional regulator with XRE-family HTH domain
MSESGLPGQDGDFFVLAEALRAFKAGPLSGRPSDRALADAAGVSPTTIGEWLRGKRFPQDVGKLLRCVRDFARKQWPLRGSPADVRCHRVLRSAGG